MTIPALFFALFVLVLWFVIGSRGHWILKVFVIGVTLHLCVSVGLSLSGFAGWPSEDSLPQKFIVHWIVIEEPDKKTKEKGAIYVWATSLGEDGTVASPQWRRFFVTLFPDHFSKPRSHVVPYSKKRHEESEGVLVQIRSGKIVIGEKGAKGKGDGEDGEGDGGRGDGSEKGNEGGSFSQSDDLTFHELPPPRLPKK